MQLTPLLVEKWRIVKSAIHDTRERESALMNNLTPRGWFVFGIAVGLAVWGLWEVAAHLLWNGSGWQWCDDLAACDKAFTR
jgi:hypothetical protein